MKQAVVCICNICHPFMLSSHLWSFLDDARVVVKCFEIREPYWSTITCIVIVYVCIGWGLFSACQRHSRDIILLNTFVLQKDIQCIKTIYDSIIQYAYICINIHVIIKGNAIYTLTLSWPREIDAYLIVRNLELTMDKPYIVRFWKVVVPMVSKMFHEVDKWFKKSKKHIWGSEVLQVWPPNCSLGFHFSVHLVHCFFASVRLFYKASRQRGTTSYACHAPWNRSDRKWCDFGTGLICRTTTCWSNILMCFPSANAKGHLCTLHLSSFGHVFFFTLTIFGGFVNWGTPKSCKIRPCSSNSGDPLFH